jgi:cellulose synthase/poly-beta-1,6-N-acetylglucosamine synthase-like glycosyltransferase/transposase-like protein
MSFTADQKLQILNKAIIDRLPISQVCRQNSISRKTYYQWYKIYEQSSNSHKKAALANHYVNGQRHPRSKRHLFKSIIIKIIARHPDWESRQIADYLTAINQPLSIEAVSRLLADLSLSTADQRHALSQRYQPQRSSVSTQPTKISAVRLKPESRQQIVEEVVKNGQSVSQVCRKYLLSRKTFYQWLQRYRQAQQEGQDFTIALADHYVQGGNHPNITSERLKEIVLKMVALHPELSSHKIASELKVLSNHGVQNILKRSDLNTLAKRIAYSQSLVKPEQAVVIQPIATDTIKTPAGSLPVVSAIPPPSPAIAPVLTGAEAGLPSFAKTAEDVPSFVPVLSFHQRLLSFFKTFLISLTASTLVSTAFIYWLSIIVSASTASQQVGLLFATIALTIGGFFFAYSLKYYFTLAIVLSFSRQSLANGNWGIQVNAKIKTNNNPSWLKDWLVKLFGVSGGAEEPVIDSDQSWKRAPGLEPFLETITLNRQPFISIHLPLYNEKNVVKRLLEACAALDYHTPEGQPAFEVLVCDDSTDETTTIIQNYLKDYPSNHPQGPTIRLLHREDRSGYKGGALGNALKEADPRTEFVAVFDADFVPYPDTLELFVKYFKVNLPNMANEVNEVNQAIQPTMANEANQPNSFSSFSSEDYTQSNIAVVGGYQWHVLNKSENWITRGVRTEYAGSYVVERPGQEILGLLKQISGSVYLIRADILRKVGWGTSITEDFQLTLKLYEQGYKVVYTPYVQAPAECASTLRRLIRQRMRWAEGHSHNIKKMFTRLMKSPNLTKPEKLEFLYLAPYYLQAAFFLVGTLSWLISETVFRAKLPFWTSLWGWSLVLTNTLSLPLVNAVGLFMEEAEEKDYLGLLSFVLLSYLLVPFQAYASLKGFLEKDEGTWFRTPKTGRVTDVFQRGKFYRWVAGFFGTNNQARPRLSPLTSLTNQGIAAISQLAQTLDPAPSAYLALATANSTFNQFRVSRKKQRWLAKATISILLIISLNLVYLTGAIQTKPQVYGFADLTNDPKPVIEPANNLPTQEQSDEYYNKLYQDAKEEVVSERKEYSKVYEAAPGLRMQLIGQEPIHYQDDQGQWQEIDLNIKDWQMTKNKFQVYFQSGSTSGYLVKYQTKDGEIEFGIDSQQPWGKINNVSGTVDGNQIVYKNIFNGVDLRYRIFKEQLLEEFVVNDPKTTIKIGQVNKKFKTSSDLRHQLQKDGSIVFSNQDNQVAWGIPKPIMYELNNPENNNYNLHYEITQKADYYTLRKILDFKGRQWLNDNQRQYPLVIDDTVTLQGATPINTDGYVTLNTNTSAYTMANTAVTANIGTNTLSVTLYRHRAYIEFHTDDISDGITIQSVGVGLYNTRAYGAGDTVSVKQIPNAISSYTNQELYDQIGSGTTYRSQIGSFTATGANFLGFGVSYLTDHTAVDDLEADLVDNTDFAIGFLGSDETSLNHYAQFNTEDYTTDTHRQPGLVVFYSGVFGGYIKLARPLRQSFWDSINQKYWLFDLRTAADGSTTATRYGYSSDGVSWTDSAQLNVYNTNHFGVWHDNGTDDVWAVYYNAMSQVLNMRVGTISTDPSISWGAASTPMPAVDHMYDFPSVIRDSSGYCWVSARAIPEEGTGGFRVTKSDTTACDSWPASPTTLMTDVSGWPDVVQTGGYIVPLTNGRIYAVYLDFDGASTYSLKGQLYDGASWTGEASEESIDAAVPGNVYHQGMGVVAIGDDVHVTYIDANGDLMHIIRTYGSGWGSASAIDNTADFYGAALSLDTATNDLYTVYYTNGSVHGDATVYYQKYSSGSWGGAQTLASTRAIYLDTNVGTSENWYGLHTNYSGNGVVFAYWMEGIYGLEFASIIVPENLWPVAMVGLIGIRWVKKKRALSY